MLASMVIALVMFGASPGAAEQIRAMSAGAVEPGLVAAIEPFERGSGHEVRVQFGTGPQLTERLKSNEAADLLIAPAAVMDVAVASGRVDAGSRVRIGRVGVGVVVRRDAALPDISTPDALERALDAATAVVFNRASTGQYIEKLLAARGIAEAVNAKAVRVDTGEAVIARIASGSGTEIGFAAMTEIRMLEPKGVRLVGPLPPPVQNFTAYDAAIMSSASRPAARELLTYLTSPEARRHFAATGIEP